jgi:gamma-glutamyltranspeptidase/glutathione hydrolase
MKPDFAPRLLARLLGGEHLETRKPLLDRDHATSSAALGEAEAELVKSLGDGVADGAPAAAESPQTTHFSIVDAAGNAVSCTYTQSAAFGSKVVIPGTGVLLGNAMGGFSELGVNGIAPGKRMASSMTPTVVSQGGKLALVLGSPGGDTIPNTVAQVFRNLVDLGMTVDEAVAAPRLHHQYLPDKVRIEKQNPPSKAALAELAQRGHTLDLDNVPIGAANEILVDIPTGAAYGYADRREGGVALGPKKAAPVK